jgi:dienelactone hydrolase
VEGTSAQWTGEDITDRDVRQRGLMVEVDRRRVPALLWTPALPAVAGDPSGADGDGADRPAPRPLVAIGHGGSNDKRQPAVVAMAHRMVRHHGCAAIAIDGPVHGDRRADRGADPRLTLAEFGQRWAGDGEAMTDETIADWQQVIAVVQALPDIGEGPVGWWGLSMGTILGLPLVAADRRIRAAVLGLMGLTGPTRQRIAEAADAVRCPVLFLVQRDDELFPWESAVALFDRLATADKRLHAHLGPHGALPDEAFDSSERFLATHLLPAGHRRAPDPSSPPQVEPAR